MKNSQNIKFTYLLVLLTLFSFACTEKAEEILTPDLSIEFPVNKLGITTEESEKLIQINFSRALESNTQIKINLISDLEYGEYFSTEPATVNGSISLNLDKGSSSTSFKIIKKSEAYFSGEESLKFNISSVSEPNKIGFKSSLNFSFEEVVSEDGILNTDMGGAEQTHQFYIDFSRNETKKVANNLWDFAFSSGEEFRVRINYANNYRAIPIEKNSISEVTVAEVEKAKETLQGSHDAPDPMTSIDNHTGNIYETAIAEIKAENSENKVYLVKARFENENQDWVLIKIDRSGEAYQLNYAESPKSEIKTIKIDKNPEYNHVYYNLRENKTVEIEPKKTKWDIAFTKMAVRYVGSRGSSPYYFSDYIIHNSTQGDAQLILEKESKAFSDFTKTDINASKYSKDWSMIGSSWRNVFTDPPVLQGQFYLIKDAEENVYKFKINAMKKDGERGFHEVEYAIVE